MAITVRHDAPGLGVALAAGQAAGRRRRQKYVLDALQRRQNLQAQLQRDAMRNRLARDLVERRGQQAIGLQEKRGKQAEDLLGQRGDQALDVLAAQGRLRQAQIGQMGEQRVEQERVRGEYDIDQEYAEGIRRGELVLPKAARDELEQLRNAEQDLPRLGIDAQEGLQKIRQRRRELLRSAQPPDVPELTPVERARQSTVLWDPEQRDYVTREQAGPNSFPVPLNEEGFPDWRNAQVPESGVKQEKERKTELKKATDDANKLDDEWRDAQRELAKAQVEMSDVSAEEKRILKEQVVAAKDRRDKAIAERQRLEAAGEEAAPTGEPYDLAPTQPAGQYDLAPTAPDPAMAEAVSGALAQQRAVEAAEDAGQTAPVQRQATISTFSKKSAGEQASPFLKEVQELQGQVAALQREYDSINVDPRKTVPFSGWNVDAKRQARMADALSQARERLQKKIDRKRAPAKASEAEVGEVYTRNVIDPDTGKQVTVFVEWDGTTYQTVAVQEV